MIVSVLRAELRSALTWLKKNSFDAKTCSMEVQGKQLVLTVGNPIEGVWFSRAIQVFGPIDSEIICTVSLWHLVRALPDPHESDISIEIQDSRFRIFTDSHSSPDILVHIPQWPLSPNIKSCVPVVSVSSVFLSNALMKAEFCHGWSYHYFRLGLVQIIGTAKSVQIVASNFSRRSIKALVESPNPTKKAFRISLRGEVIPNLIMVRGGQVLFAENDSLVLITIVEAGNTKSTITFLKKNTKVPSSLPMLTLRRNWIFGCRVNVRKLKRAIKQLWAPANDILPKFIMIVFKPGELSLSTSFLMDAFKARVRIPIESTGSNVTKIEFGEFVLALRLVSTSVLTIYYDTAGRLIIRSKGLIQYVNALC